MWRKERIHKVSPNVLTLMGLTCIVVPHIAFYVVMGDNFGGYVPNWLLWFTAVLHMLYMVYMYIIRILTTWMANKLAGQVCIKIFRKFFASRNDLGPQFRFNDNSNLRCYVLHT